MTWGNYHNVTGAGWSVYWRIPQFSGGGLEVWWADFRGHRVMWRGSSPFAIVPYHRPVSEPPAPDFCYKDGFDTHGGGAAFTALNSAAFNNVTSFAADDTDAISVKVEAEDGFNPARLTIAAKFQCGWYQYVHSWEFNGDGAIHPSVAMAGHLNPFARSTPHVHHLYFRVDLDIDGQFPHDVVEQFDHNSLDDVPISGDAMTPINAQGKLLANPVTSRKWLVRNTVSKSAAGFKGYDIEIPQMTGRDQYSTGDLWVTVYRGDGVQQGEGVATEADKLSDIALESAYAVGALDLVNGNDIVLWAVVRSHHQPRPDGEEVEYLPFHYEEFAITPRSFELLRKRDDHQPG
jgi:Cu2+-containing amine oxidase